MAKKDDSKMDTAQVLSLREGPITTPHGVLVYNGIIEMPRAEAEEFVNRYPETRIIK
jgi:hypothetical protein